jgi:hypothetical protein
VREERITTFRKLLIRNTFSLDLVPFWNVPFSCLPLIHRTLMTFGIVDDDDGSPVIYLAPRIPGMAGFPHTAAAGERVRIMVSVFNSLSRRFHSGKPGELPSSSGSRLRRCFCWSCRCAFRTGMVVIVLSTQTLVFSHVIYVQEKRSDAPQIPGVVATFDSLGFAGILSGAILVMLCPFSLAMPARSRRNQQLHPRLRSPFPYGQRNR